MYCWLILQYSIGIVICQCTDSLIYWYFCNISQQNGIVLSCVYINPCAYRLRDISVLMYWHTDITKLLCWLILQYLIGMVIYISVYIVFLPDHRKQDVFFQRYTSWKEEQHTLQHTLQLTATHSYTLRGTNYIYIYIYMYICICIYVNIYIYVHTYTYIIIYTHISTYVNIRMYIQYIHTWNIGPHMKETR